MPKSRWVERDGQRFLVEADGKCGMPHKAMSKRGKKVCPNCGAKIGELETTEEDKGEGGEEGEKKSGFTPGKKGVNPFAKKKKVAESTTGYATDMELVEAADSMMKATVHKHGLEVKKGKKDNWIERTGKGGQGGQLPAYIQHIALAIEKTGKTKSQAIAIAISRVKAWAAGGGGVDVNTKAAAAKAVAEWTALKAKSHIKSAAKAA